MSLSDLQLIAGTALERFGGRGIAFLVTGLLCFGIGAVAYTCMKLAWEFLKWMV
jgi:hypothetical protein